VLVERVLEQVYLYQKVLSDYPRWMFKKNSMEFFVEFEYYLYYFTVAILLLVHDHMSFQNVL